MILMLLLYLLFAMIDLFYVIMLQIRVFREGYYLYAIHANYIYSIVRSFIPIIQVKEMIGLVYLVHCDSSRFGELIRKAERSIE